MRRRAQLQAVEPVPATWGAMVEAEPRLAFLEDSVRAVFDDGDPEGGFCANIEWIDFKQKLKYLVGWFAQNPALRYSEHYELAYHRLYNLLPPCRRCGCL